MNLKNAVDVLIVDEEEAIGLAELLRTAGFSVKVAATDIVLRLLGYLDVGVILLDVDVDKTDSIALLEALDSPIPLVILSSGTLDDDELKRIGSKVVMQLQKPVEPHHLVRVVGAMLGRF